MTFAAGVAVALIGSGLLVDHRPMIERWLQPIQSLGRLALSAYFAHVAVGLCLLLVLSEGRAPAWVALAATGAFVVVATIIAHAMVRRGLQGPLERLVRR